MRTPSRAAWNPRFFPALLIAVSGCGAPSADRWQAYLSSGQEAVGRRDFAGAESQLNKALTLARRMKTPNEMEAVVLNRLAVLSDTMGKGERADALYSQSAEAFGKSLGGHHPKVVLALLSQAVSKRNRKRTEEADTIIERVSKIVKEPDFLGQAGASEGICGAARYYDAFGPEQAKWSGEDCIEQTQKEFGAASVQSARALNDVAEIFRKLGMLSDADVNLAKSLSIYEALYGPNDIRMAAPLNNAGSLFLSCGERSKALTEYLRAEDIIEKHEGKEGFDLVYVYLNLGDLYYDEATYEPALNYYRLCETIWKKARGADNAGYVDLLRRQKVLFEKMGLPEEAGEIQGKILKAEMGMPSGSTSSSEGAEKAPAAFGRTGG